MVQQIWVTPLVNCQYGDKVAMKSHTATKMVELALSARSQKETRKNSCCIHLCQETGSNRNAMEWTLNIQLHGPYLAHGAFALQPYPTYPTGRSPHLVPSPVIKVFLAHSKSGSLDLTGRYAVAPDGGSKNFPDWLAYGDLTDQKTCEKLRP